MTTGAKRLGPLVALAGVTLSGCMVGPNFKPPAPPSVEGYLPGTSATVPVLNAVMGEPAQRFVAAKVVDPDWWRMFGSARLNALEDEALHRNTDVAVAQATFRQARELYLAQRASLLPQVQFAGSATRSKNSDTIASPLSSNAQSYALYNAQLNLSYVLDVFGGARRAIENTAALADQQRYQADAVYLTLSSNVATTVLQIAGLNDQIRATEAVVAANRRVLALTRQLEARGEASTADVAAAEAAAEAAIQPLRPLQKQVAQLADLLAVYIGRAPAELDLPQLSLADMTIPSDLPVTVPSDLVRQRPDIRASQANLHAASAAVGVALAARLPNFDVTAMAGGTSTALGSLLSGPNTLWTIGADAGATVFDAGALRHRQRAAEAALDQAKAQYRGVVLTALQNVADALQALTTDTQALGDAARGADVQSRALRIATAEAELGQTSALPRLNAEIAYRQAQLTLVQARAARQTDAVALFMALGGGWRDPAGQEGAKRPRGNG